VLANEHGVFVVDTPRNTIDLLRSDGKHGIVVASKRRVRRVHLNCLIALNGEMYATAFARSTRAMGGFLIWTELQEFLLV